MYVRCRHLAVALTQGKKIEPELFESVTIGFTALANFGDIALQSTPMQIVSLLNDLYSMFDAALERFDVYKVETISDSYMVRSKWGGGGFVCVVCLMGPSTQPLYRLKKLAHELEKFVDC